MGFLTNDLLPVRIFLLAGSSVFLLSATWVQGSTGNFSFAIDSIPGDELVESGRKLFGGDSDYEDLGWDDAGGKPSALNLLEKAADGFGTTELLGKVKDWLSVISKGADALKTLGKGGQGDEGAGELEDWDAGHEVEHEQNSPYPDVPVIDVPGKKKIGPPLEFGNYNRVGVGSWVDGLAIVVAAVVWLTFFALVLPLFYGGQLGRKKRSLGEDLYSSLPVNGDNHNDRLQMLTEFVSKVLDDGDCFEYITCSTAKAVPSIKSSLGIVRFVAQLPSEKISRPARRIRRALTAKTCDVFKCSR